MTREDKELLLKDLCARLPYGVICYDEAQKETGIFKHFEYEGFGRIHNGRGVRFIENIKPYLFPMSSMTEGQMEELLDIVIPTNNGSGIVEESNIGKYIDFCNSHHLDYRGLIEKSLALDATNKNIY